MAPTGTPELPRSRESLWFWIAGTLVAVGLAIPGTAVVLYGVRPLGLFWTSLPMICTYVSFLVALGCFVCTVREIPFPFASGQSRQTRLPARRLSPWPSAVQHEKQILIGEIPREPAGYRKREDLFAALDQPTGMRDASAVQSIIGMVGVGKTHLAAEYARKRRADGWRLVAWINAGDEPAVSSGLVQVASALGLRNEGSDAKAAGYAVRHWLEADGSRCLLVFNDVINLKALGQFLPAGGDARVLITTNLQASARLGQSVMVSEFSEAESLAFLAGRTNSADTAGARAVAAELGCLPLALAAAAALIASQRLEYAVYLRRLRALPLDRLLPKVEADEYPRSVEAAVLLSLDGVRGGDQTGELCVAVMEMVSVLSAGAVPRGLLHAAVRSGALARLVAARSISDDVVDEALGRLAGSSLLTFSVDGGHVGAHPLVRRVVRDMMVVERRFGTVCEAVSGALICHASSVRAAWEQSAVRDLVEQISAAYEHMKSPSGEVHGGLIWYGLRLRLERARFLDDLGDSPARATEAGIALLRDAERELGADDPFTLTCRHNLAIAYQQAGRLGEAIVLYEQNLADREHILGSDDPATLASRNNLATAYQDTGRHGEAIMLYEQNLAEREQILGTYDPDTLASRNNLATAYCDADRPDEAIALHEMNLAASAPDAGQPGSPIRPNRPVAVRRDKRRVGQTIPLHERTRGDGRRTIGAGHPDSLGYQNNLAIAYLKADRIREATAKLTRLFKDKEDILGRGHPSILVSQNNLAVAYLEAGRVRQAAGLLADTLTQCERTLDPTHHTTETVRRNLSVARQAMKTTPGWRRILFQ